MRSAYGFALVVLHSCLLALAGCTRIEAPLPHDELVVALRNTPAFTQDEGGGFERDLVERFGQELGLNVRLILVRDHDELIALLKEGKVHFAASATVFEGIEGIRYSKPLREARQVLIQSADAITADGSEVWAGHSVEVLGGSPQAAALKSMKTADSATGAGGAVSFPLVEQSGLTEIDLLERVSERKSELAATDSLHFDIAAAFFPDLQIAQVLAGSVRFAWAFPLDGDPELYAKAQSFITRIQKDGTQARLHDRYFGHIHRLDQFSIVSFLERIASTLPRLRNDFIAAQEITGIDWRLLAALAYQESLWDPLATSPTNVRGIMMLTEETADHLKVTNRLDAKQSIRAGAKYLADLIDELPAEIPQPDRTWMGLAAYNLGQGHMNGARAIAKSLKRDATSWYEMKQVLPLMAREEYYKRLKSGRARGGEAVIMVENIRKLYDILSRFEPLQPARKSGAPGSVVVNSGAKSSADSSRGPLWVRGQMVSRGLDIASRDTDPVVKPR